MDFYTDLHLQPLSDLEHFDHLEKSDEPSKKYPDGGHQVVNDIRGKHRGLKDEYDSLHKKVARGKDSKEFSEPRVSGLWRLALNADFTPEELDSLHVSFKNMNTLSNVMFVCIINCTENKINTFFKCLCRLN